MSRYKRASGDVTRWPDSPDARKALQEWFTDASATAYLSGDLLDFRGADLSRLDLAGAYLANSHLAGVRFEEANLGDAATAQTTQGRSPLGPALSFVLLRRAEDTRFELVRV